MDCQFPYFFNLILIGCGILLCRGFFYVSIQIKQSNHFSIWISFFNSLFNFEMIPTYKFVNSSFFFIYLQIGINTLAVMQYTHLYFKCQKNAFFSAFIIKKIIKYIFSSQLHYRIIKSNRMTVPSSLLTCWKKSVYQDTIVKSEETSTYQELDLSVSVYQNATIRWQTLIFISSMYLCSCKTWNGWWFSCGFQIHISFTFVKFELFWNKPTTVAEWLHTTIKYMC